MSKNVAFVLDIGSSKITALAGGAGINDNFLIFGRSSIPYSGFSDGSFFEEEKLEEKISQAIEDVELASNISTKKITLAVPSEFCISKNKKITIDFNTLKRLTEDFVKQICAKACEEIDGQTLIGVYPIYCILDDGNKITDLKYSPKTTKLFCFFNAIYADSNFVTKMNEILSLLGIQKVHYVCSIYCETQYLINPEKIAGNTLLIDIGYLTTGVAVAKNKGLLKLNSFSLGGGHIMGDLAQCLNIPIKQAENLKRKIVVSVRPSASDMYEIEDTEPKKVYANVANQIVSERLDMFATFISKCIKPCFEKGTILSAFLTGGGISYIKGAREYLSGRLGVNLELAEPAQVPFDRPIFSSEISVLDYALKQFEKKHKGILAKILN
ncbi:MAG: cell division FtsA domain-containing protein [Clostridia bacterium]|jgi:cell division protein FtsA|nr:cell division FtsA domain-containing protein [Clostridia bacterium]MDD3232168.1 cell division FtsA domain-containing protein [Clostridia bacterium]MDD3862731.1 cell division FtsA domain-containing protein [Clostridia bacterium]MDD4408543.1 cell division FtsA domain-containing protein [Clostridia bacterium]